MATGADIVATARSQISVVESPRGSNRNPYGRAYGANGLPWCSQFVWWVFNRNGINLKKLSDNPAYTPNLWNDLKVRGWAVGERDAKPGDICFFDFAGGKHRIEHVGIVVENRFPNFVTIEGNTSGGNNSNGGAVLQRGRDSGQIVGVIRVPLLTPPRTEAPKNPPPLLTPTAAQQFAQVAAALEFCKHAIVGIGHVTTGPAVTFVQQGINGLRIPGLVLTVDGSFDRATYDAIKWVQATHGLVADGTVGPATWRVLFP